MKTHYGRSDRGGCETRADWESERKYIALGSAIACGRGGYSPVEVINHLQAIQWKCLFLHRRMRAMLGMSPGDEGTSQNSCTSIIKSEKVQA